jgi:hypothetical protein
MGRRGFVVIEGVYYRIAVGSPSGLPRTSTLTA